MFHFHIITLFPEIFGSFLSTSLVGKALRAGLLGVQTIDPREFTDDRHNTVDDAPYGGGDGMVMKPEPLVAALESLPEDAFRVLLSPQGEPLGQHHLEELHRKGRVALVCGRYEGFDERVRSRVHRELSLGDFVLCGGEVAAMALVEGVSRLVPGVLGNEGSLRTESHRGGLLEHPQYTRPRDFRGELVPEVLLSGNHDEIRRWRRLKMMQRTRERRPDLWSRFDPLREDLELLEKAGQGVGDLASRSYVALMHHPVKDREGRLVTTAVTNLDLHDIARSCCSYGLARYFVVTPLESQRSLVERILDHWRTGHGSRVNRLRGEALSLLEVACDLDGVLEAIVAREGRRPLVLGTSAAAIPGQVSRGEVLERLEPGQPLLLVLGTGWGLTEDFLNRCDLLLRPIMGRPSYNHLSVRSAAAIMLDRFFSMVQ